MPADHDGIDAFQRENPGARCGAVQGLSNGLYPPPQAGDEFRRLPVYAPQTSPTSVMLSNMSPNRPWLKDYHRWAAPACPE